MPGPIVTLTTDFGTADPFVGTMKGVILGINPHVAIVDITHEVPPQDVHGGAFLFDTACRYFPGSTIHTLVVDPGVGTGRPPLLVVGPDAYFVGPDNGILSYCYVRAGFSVPDADPFTQMQVRLPPGWHAYHLTNEQYQRHPVSSTFHGRDVFAPAAAYLSRGVPPGQLGTKVEYVTAFSVPKPEQDGDGLVGRVLQVDRFGNLVTNIPAAALVTPDAALVIEVDGQQVKGLARSYQDGEPLLAIIGSHGYLELGATNRSAAELLGVGAGAVVRVAVA